MEKMVDPHPVGFRFHPTDEEIIGYYLREKNMDSFDPWELPSHSSSIRKDDVWYFFARKDNKYVHTKKKSKDDKYNRGTPFFKKRRQI
ncbi:hypothetical protein BRARA_H02010 [Brassica rapa]|uniref:NAC domain-containing protein n=1 Tax=Brassica campestris TaxID=3711 RepID=A0A397YEN3_BRACM|nr:hypothetical protein BRARA_H02010 [Brassica rapa]